MTTRTTEIELFDEARQRPVPVRWYGLDEAGLRGWILFSVGFGGSLDSYAYLGRAWLNAGLAVGVIEHVGSNLEVLKSIPFRQGPARDQRIVELVADPVEQAERGRDLCLVHSKFASHFSGLPLGLGGHSFGSFTALCGMGLSNRWGFSLESSLPVSALLLISPSPPGTLIDYQAYSQLETPVLVLTGTRDRLMASERGYRDRTLVYQALPESVRNLVVLEGAEHMDFAGIGLNIGATMQKVSAVTTVWWEQVLMASTFSPEDRRLALAEALADEAWSELC